MMDRSDNDGSRRPGTRPFVSGRAIAPVVPVTSSVAPPRPFPFAGARTNTTAGAMTTASSTITAPGGLPTPHWTVAVYEPGMERASSPEPNAPVPSIESAPRLSEKEGFAEASLALADDIVEAGRHATSLAAAEVLELLARRLRRGEILLLPGASTQTDASVVSAVLAALLGGRR